MNTCLVKITLVSLMFSLCFSSARVVALSDQEPELWVASGFPYKNLVQRYDVVKIHYTNLEAEGLVQCRVELISNTNSNESENLKVSQKRFHEKPLQSCIDRDVAIKALELAFAD